MKIILHSFFAFLMLSLHPSLNAAEHPVYVLQDLGTLGGRETVVTAVNKRGQVIGYSTVGDCNHAFLLSEGKMIDLGTLGGACSYPERINNLGQVLGNSGTSDGGWHSFLYSNGQITDLFAALDGEANDLNFNDLGQIVGNMRDSNHRNHPFIYTDNNIIMLDDSVGKPGGFATGINNLSQVSLSLASEYGCSQMGCYDTYAFIFTNNYLMRLNPDDTEDSSYTRGINEYGHVLGGYTDSSGMSRAFLYKDSKFTPIIYSADEYTTPIAMNDAGQVIFFSGVYGGDQHPCLFDNGAITDISPPSRYSTMYSTPISINNSGQVLINTYEDLLLYTSGKWMSIREIISPYMDLDSLDLNEGGFISDTGIIYFNAYYPGRPRRAYSLTPIYEANDFVFPLLGISQKEPLKNRKDPLEDGWNGYGFGVTSARDGHLGQDYYLQKGDSSGKPVFAVANGEVVEVLNGPGKYGWCDNDHHGWGPVVVIKHINNLRGFKTSARSMCDPNDCGTERNPKVVYSLYGHLSKESIKNLHVGTSVLKGDQIAVIGKKEVDHEWDTNHLHFEIKDQAGFKVGNWYVLSDANHGKCPQVTSYPCNGREVLGVGTGYSYRNGFAPYYYNPSVFIMENCKQVIMPAINLLLAE